MEWIDKVGETDDGGTIWADGNITYPVVFPEFEDDDGEADDIERYTILS